MSFQSSDVSKMAHLSRLAIEDQDLTRFAHDLSDILEMAGRLQEVDVGDAGPMAHPLDLTQRLRADVVTEGDEREAFQSQAPAAEDGLYLVPRVIE